MPFYASFFNRRAAMNSTFPRTSRRHAGARQLRLHGRGRDGFPLGTCRRSGPATGTAVPRGLLAQPGVAEVPRGLCPAARLPRCSGGLREPLHEWKSVILNAEERRLLALFEIVLLNKPAAPDAGPEVLPWKAYEQLVQAIEDAADCLKKNQGRKFPPARGRWGATTLTDEQKATWIHETDPRAGKAVDRQSRSGDLVIRHMDGRVEVPKDEARKEVTRGKAKIAR